MKIPLSELASKIAKHLSLKSQKVTGFYISADGQAHHYIRDHQGNVRQVTDSDGNVEQDSHYYPYGMLMGESSDILATARNGRNPLKPSDANPYLYGSKEYLTTAGANLLDFTARTYDPSILLFHTPDPLRDNYLHVNSYLYCLGNPTNFIDPTGMKVAYGENNNDTKLKAMVENQRNDMLFDMVFQNLENSKEVYTYKFEEFNFPEGHVPSESEFFNGKYDRHTKTISLNPGLTESAFNLISGEETYHAFQDIIRETGVNIEFEAKVFAKCHVINLGIDGFSVEIGMEGFLDIYDSLYPEEINLNPPYNKMRISDDLYNIYVKGGKPFFDTYKDSNLPGYGDEITKMPDRLVNLLIQYSNGKQ